MQPSTPNQNFNNYSNIATIVSAAFAILTAIISCVLIFGIYKTKIDDIQNNMNKLENSDSKMQDEIKLLRDQTVRANTSIDILLEKRPASTLQSTTP